MKKDQLPRDGFFLKLEGLELANIGFDERTGNWSVDLPPPSTVSGAFWQLYLESERRNAGPSSHNTRVKAEAQKRKIRLAELVEEERRSDAKAIAGTRRKPASISVLRHKANARLDEEHQGWGYTDAALPRAAREGAKLLHSPEVRKGAVRRGAAVRSTSNRKG